MKSTQTDETLVELIAQGDRDAFAELHHRYAASVYSLICHIVKDTAVADELLQETFWQIWEKADQYSRWGSAAAWLFQIGRNKSLDELRRQKARPQPVIHRSEREKEKVWSKLEAKDANVEHISEQMQLKHHLREALNHLPDEQRECLLLAYFEGLTQRQIAEQTNTPLGTVKTRISLAIDKLKRSLSLSRQ